MSATHARSRLGLLSAVKFTILAFVSLGFSPLPAQIASSVPPPVQFGPNQLSKEELNRLLGPIALYPDALIGLILPASTVPSDVVLASRYLKSGGDATRLESQPWDDSVKSLARYADVVTWMDQNLEWTASLGEAFVEQPADVMAAIQSLREQAKAAGNLVDTPQQKVVEEESALRILPADPEVIYVPQYDPQVVFIQSYTTVPIVTFGLGFAVGTWLIYDFDWNRRCFYRGNWRGWDRNNIPNRGQVGNRACVVNIDANNANPWQPGENARRQTAQRQMNSSGNARYAASGTAVRNLPTQPSVPGGVSRQAVQPGNVTPATGTSLPRPTNFQRLPGRSVQNPAQAGNAGTPTSITGVPTAAPGITSDPSRTIVPSFNSPGQVNPRVQNPDPQPSYETPESRYRPPQVQQRLQPSQRQVPVQQFPQQGQPRLQSPQTQVPMQPVPRQVPQQRPAPFMNPQMQPQSVPVSNTPGRQQPASGARGISGGG